MELDHEIDPPEGAELHRVVDLSTEILALAAASRWDGVLEELSKVPCTCVDMIPIMVIWVGTALGAHQHVHPGQAFEITFITKDPKSMEIKSSLEPWEAAGETFLNLISSGDTPAAVEGIHTYWHGEKDGTHYTDLILGILETCSIMAADSARHLIHGSATHPFLDLAGDS